MDGIDISLTPPTTRAPLAVLKMTGLQETDELEINLSTAVFLGPKYILLSNHSCGASKEEKWYGSDR